MLKSSCSSRQVVERFGGASRARTNDLIVANDVVRRNHLTDSSRLVSSLNHFSAPFIGPAVGQTLGQSFLRTLSASQVHGAELPARSGRRCPWWSRCACAASDPVPISGRRPLEPARLRVRYASSASSRAAP